jgi:hypothetical protein
MTEAKPTYTLPIADYRLGPYLSELRCKTCHATLATVVEWDGRTALVLFTREGHPCLAFRARLHCVCGAERTFRSELMSAVRLGIAEE